MYLTLLWSIFRQLYNIHPPTLLSSIKYKLCNNEITNDLKKSINKRERTSCYLKFRERESTFTYSDIQKQKCREKDTSIYLFHFIWRRCDYSNTSLNIKWSIPNRILPKSPRTQNSQLCLLECAYFNNLQYMEIERPIFRIVLLEDKHFWLPDNPDIDWAVLCMLPSQRLLSSILLIYNPVDTLITCRPNITHCHCLSGIGDLQLDLTCGVSSPVICCSQEIITFIWP